MSTHQFCDGVHRRDFLKAGAIGGLGLSLASYLRMAKAGEIAPAKGRSAIFIHLGGGPTHMDTFDLKPDAPAEYRGEFKPINTNVAGMRDLRAPAQARQMRRQVRDPSRRQPHAGRARSGHRLHEHRQPPAAVARLSELRRRGRARNCRPPRICRRSSPFRTPLSGPAISACNMRRSKRTPRRSPASRLPSAALRSAAG